MRVALIGLDYDSSFFKRGKQACFKVMKQCDQFISAFRFFGDYSHSRIGKFCVSFMLIQCTDINKVWQKMFEK